MKEQIYEICKGNGFVEVCYEYNNANCNHSCNYAKEKDNLKGLNKTIKEIKKVVEVNRINRGLDFVIR